MLYMLQTLIDPPYLPYHSPYPSVPAFHPVHPTYSAPHSSSYTPSPAHFQLSSLNTTPTAFHPTSLLPTSTPHPSIFTTHSSTSTSHPPTSTTPPLASTSNPVSSHPLLSPEEVVRKYPYLRGDNKMGKLAVALARESVFGRMMMSTSSVGGRMQGVSPLPTEGLEKIRQVIFSLCPAYHNSESAFETTIWNKCKTAINHACLKHRINK